MKPSFKIVSIILLSFSLSGCSVLPFKKKSIPEDQDGPPKISKSVHHIPDARPIEEPKSKYGNPPTYEVFGKKYHVMDSSLGYNEVGIASWYGMKFHGRRTSSGEPYDVYGMTAAHKTLPLPTYAKVENLKNGKSVVVKINDRGPFVGNRIIDLSYAAARKLGVYDHGTAQVRVTAINPKNWGKYAAPVTEAQPTPIKGNFYLQLGAFSKKPNAEKLADKALPLTNEEDDLGIKILETTGSKGALYKVWLGPITDKLKAELLKTKIFDLNIADANIISE